MKILDSVNDPGKPGKTGDDRFGYDAQAGRAWVLDGATDVTDLRPFPQSESGAAWFAETLSGWLMANAPAPDENAEAYFRRALEGMREAAARDSKIPLENIPLNSSPIASGVWMRLTGGSAEFSWLGDCVALVDPGDGRIVSLGAPDKADTESADALELLKRSEEEKWAALAEERAAQNSGNYWVFGLNPDAASRLNTETVALQPGARALIMTDGLYRLVNPYGLYSEKALLDFAAEEGLLAAIRELRAFEGRNAPGADLPRVKRSDDAAALFIDLTEK